MATLIGLTGKMSFEQNKIYSYDGVNSDLLYPHTLCLGVPEGCSWPVPRAGEGQSSHKEDFGSAALYQGLVSQVNEHGSTALCQGLESQVNGHNCTRRSFF